MTRYLFFISYLGTRFRGIQKQLSRSTPQLDDPFTVQGMLEIALKRLHPVNFPATYISSRTDAGVHAFRNSVHVDLERNGREYCPQEIVSSVNRYFEKSDIAIRVQECRVVPETFNARHNAIKRSYLYRLAVRKENATPLPTVNSILIAQIPFNEWRRCHFIQNSEFDVDKFRKAATLFPGEQDFRTFMGSIKNQRGETSSVRLLYNIDITPGHAQNYCPFASDYEYWDIVCSGRSFVFRQVRRMVGVLVAVAQGKLQYSDVQYMMAEPSLNSWNTRVVPLPAYGLYLLNIEYNPSDFIVEESSSEVTDETIVKDQLSLNLIQTEH